MRRDDSNSLDSFLLHSNKKKNKRNKLPKYLFILCIQLQIVKPSPVPRNLSLEEIFASFNTGITIFLFHSPKWIEYFCLDSHDSVTPYCIQKKKRYLAQHQKCSSGCYYGKMWSLPGCSAAFPWQPLWLGNVSILFPTSVFSVESGSWKWKLDYKIMH